MFLRVSQAKGKQKSPAPETASTLQKVLSRWSSSHQYLVESDFVVLSIASESRQYWGKDFRQCPGGILVLPVVSCWSSGCPPGPVVDDMAGVVVLRGWKHGVTAGKHGNHLRPVFSQAMRS